MVESLEVETLEAEPLVEVETPALLPLHVSPGLPGFVSHVSSATPLKGFVWLLGLLGSSSHSLYM